MSKQIVTKSATTPKIFNFMKENLEKEFTYAELATELGFDKVTSVLGAANGLKKKGYLVDGAEKVVGDKTYKTIKMVEVADIVFVEEAVTDSQLTDNAKAVLKILSNGEVQTAGDIAAIINGTAIGVTGTLKPLVTKGIVEKTKTKVVVAGAEKEVTNYKITDQGLTVLKEML